MYPWKTQPEALPLYYLSKLLSYEFIFKSVTTNVFVFIFSFQFICSNCYTVLSHLIVEEEDEDVAMGERERDGEDDGNAVGQRKSQRKRRRPSKLDNAMNEDAKAPKKKKGGSKNNNRTTVIYSCSKCDFTSNNAGATTGHERAHTGQFVTCVCGFKSDIKGHFNSSSRNYHRCEQAKAARAANSYSISTSSSTSSSSSVASPKSIKHSSTNASAASRRRLGDVIDLQISDQTINESNHLVNQNKAIRQHLHPYKTLQDDFECDGCNNLFKKDTILYGCVSCDHDLCDDCLRQAIESPLEWKESVFCSALAVKNRKRSRSNSNDSLLSPPFKKQKKIKDKYKGMSKQERREARKKNNERKRLNKMRRSSSSSTTSSASPPTSASIVSTGVTPAHLSFTLAQMSGTDEEGESDWL